MAEALEVAVEIEISIDALGEIHGHRLGDGALVAIGNLQGGNRTPMFQQPRAEPAVTLGHQAALFLPLDLSLHLFHRPGRRRLVDATMRTGIAVETVIAAHLVVLFRRTDVIARGRGDTVQATVIETDPLPAMIHRAHVLPEETEGDKDPTRPHHLHADIGAREDTPPYQGHDLGPVLTIVVE